MLTTTCVLICFVAAALAVSRPPEIQQEPPVEVFFKLWETVQLPCIANAEPQPVYRWKKNGIDFNPSDNGFGTIQLPEVGTLFFLSPEVKDEGIFQCFAVNSFGTSASKKINLRQARLLPFAYASPTYYNPRLGTPLTLNCVPPESVPPATVVWITKQDNGGIEVYNYNNRVTIDREYRLRFTNVKAADAMEGMPYVCVAMNRNMRLSVQGSLHYINPTGTTEDYSDVAYMWSDQVDRFGLRGETFSVKCIFSGNPTPDVHWYRTDNKTMSERANFKSFYQELEITNLQFEDSGSYECWATNPISTRRTYKTFNIIVKSAPYLIDEPKGIEVGVGANVTFNCTAGGVPDPDIDWFINGVPLKDVTDPRIKGPRFQRPSEDIISLENVQLTDHMVIQCNASNIYGYAFADFYLNVLYIPASHYSCSDILTHEDITSHCSYSNILKYEDVTAHCSCSNILTHENACGGLSLRSPSNSLYMLEYS